MLCALVRAVCKLEACVRVLGLSDQVMTPLTLVECFLCAPELCARMGSSRGASADLRAGAAGADPEAHRQVSRGKLCADSEGNPAWQGMTVPMRFSISANCGEHGGVLLHTHIQAASSTLS